MSRQDRQGVRTPADIERKYDLGQLANNAVSYKKLETQVNQQSQTLAQYMVSSEQELKEVKKDIEALQNNTEQGTFTTDETLSFTDGVLSVNTADKAEKDNPLPMTSGAVYELLGKPTAEIIDGVFYLTNPTLTVEIKDGIFYLK